MGRGRSGHGDGLALQSVVVHGGVIAVGGVLHHGDHRAGVLLSDEVGHLLALQSGLQSQGLGGGLVALLDGQDVGVSGGAALDEQGVVHGVQAGVDGVVAVDDGVVHVRQQVGELGGLGLHDLHVVGVVHDVVLGGGDAHAVLQLDDAVLLEQQQGAGFVGGVVGNTDLDGGSGGLIAAVGIGLAAAGSQAQGQHNGQGQRHELGESVMFHVFDLLCRDNDRMEWGLAAADSAGVSAHPAVCRREMKNSGRSFDLPLLVHTPAFSSRQTVIGKLMTLLSATEHAHGHHTHAHLAHHHRNGTLHVSFPP